MEIQRELDDYEKERVMLEEQATQEGAEPDYERMAFLKSKEAQLSTELNALLEKGDPQLSMENLAHVIELWTKIPAAKTPGTGVPAPQPAGSTAPRTHHRPG